MPVQQLTCIQVAAAMREEHVGPRLVQMHGRAQHKQSAYRITWGELGAINMHSVGRMSMTHPCHCDWAACRKHWRLTITQLCMADAEVVKGSCSPLQGRLHSLVARGSCSSASYRKRHAIVQPALHGLPLMACSKAMRLLRGLQECMASLSCQQLREMR